jgi:predicted unusual protein kinase regulating ubiquinone biosynthesis (AarF/ABC1/UbiB family)
VQNVATAMAHWNIFYIKFFQWFANNSFPEKELNSFFNLFKSNVPYNMEDINTDLLKQVLAELPGLTIHPHPVNSGTIALVFKGELNGKPVCVKLVRNNIEATMNAMFTQCKILNLVFKCIPGIDLHIVEWMDDIKETFYSQIDFIKEGGNAELFYQKFKKNKNIVIPQIYFAHKQVLVMDYLENFDKSLWEVSDYRAYSKLFINFMISSYFIKDIYHGDLHTGNLVFLKDAAGTHRLGVIDFGMVGHLSVDNQNLIYNIFSVNEKNDYRELVRHYIDYISLKSNIERKDLIIADAIAALEKNQCTDLRVFSHKHMRIISNILTKYQITFDKNINIYLFSTMAMIGTITELSAKDDENNLHLLFRKLQDLNN